MRGLLRAHVVYRPAEQSSHGESDQTADGKRNSGAGGTVRVEHHVVLGAELRLRLALEDVLELGDALLHERPAFLQIDGLPLVRRHRRRRGRQIGAGGLAGGGGGGCRNPSSSRRPFPVWEMGGRGERGKRVGAFRGPI